jgi:recombination protein RecT
MADDKKKNGNGGAGEHNLPAVKEQEFNPAPLHNKAIAAAGGRQTLEKYLEAYQSYLVKALPQHMDPGKMIRVVLTATTQNPDLLRCSFSSVMAAVLQASQLGLYPDGALGRAYIIPYKGEAKLIPGYKGLIDLARNSGLVTGIYAHVVYEKEPFSITYGDDNRLTHTPLPPTQRGEKRVGAYAVATFRDGTKHFEWLWADEVQGIRDKSPAAKSAQSPWNSKTPSDVDEMWRKTAIRRLAKFMPASPELQQFHKAVELDAAAEAGLPQHLDLDLPIDMTEDEAGRYGVDPDKKASDAAAGGLRQDLFNDAGQDAPLMER